MFLRFLNGRYALPLAFHAEDDGGSGGGDGKREKVRATDVHERYNGDSMRMAEKLAEFQEDNYRLRDKVRQLTADLDTTKKLVAPDGARVLTADEAKAWEAYQALGKPEDLDKAVKERDTAAGELAGLKRTEAVRQAATVEKLNADALAALPGLPPIIVKDVKEGEATVKRAYVTPEGGTEMPLTDYGKQHHAALWSAVEATGGGEGERRESKTRVPPQSTGGDGGKPNVARDVVKRQYSLPGQAKKQ